MPKSELDPVSDDEWLLRRVRHERIQKGASPLISPSAFGPRVKGREPDVDGISFYRAACLEDVVSIVPLERRSLEGVVRIPVSTVRALGLTIDSKPFESISGHVVLREMNAEAMKTNRPRIAELMIIFATIASEPGNILVWPSMEQ